MTYASVVPALASTVVLVRARPHGLEALLTKRPASMAFAPNVHVFPGGRVDDDDADAALFGRSVIGPGEAAMAMGGDLEPGLALAAHIAAVRELFEEAGVLLADLGSPGGRDGMTRPNAPLDVPNRLLGEARSALVGGEASFGSIARDLGLRLRTDLLVPLSRWVTPPVLPRRFDARFFAAELPAGARVTFEGDEVAGHAWLTPAAALDAMAAREIEMWLPTSATLQQLVHATSVDEMRARLSPGILVEVEVDGLAPEVTRIVMPSAGGVAGQPVCAYLVGRRRHVLIDPGDPTGPSLDRAQALAAARGGSIDAVALTQVEPDHAGGAEALAAVLGIPVFAGPGGGRPLPYAVRELADLEVVPGCDVPLRAIHAPGPGPDHLAFIVDSGGTGFVVAGDLDGHRGDRSITAPMDEDAAASARDRLQALAPGAVWLAGHPTSRGPGVPRRDCAGS